MPNKSALQYGSIGTCMMTKLVHDHHLQRVLGCQYDLNIWIFKYDYRTNAFAVQGEVKVCISSDMRLMCVQSPL